MLGCITISKKHENGKSWNKSTRDLGIKHSWNLSLNDETEKEVHKRWKKEKSGCSSKSSSTLSLHIAAYESSIEVASNENQDTKKSEIIVSNSLLKTFPIQDGVEFLRQREGKERVTPEVQQFKASQRLHSPQQNASSNQSKSRPLLKVMSSKQGPRAAGTDGSDFQHRQRIAAQYQTSASYKFYLKALFGLHFTVLLALWAKVFGEIAVNHLGVKSALWKRLDLPSAYPWEYVWCFSIIPILLALYAMPKNRVKPMTYAYYGQFFTGILPCSLGLGSQFPELISYIADPVNNESSFPMVVIWFIFFLIAFQLHIFAMYFKYYLLAAWNPLPVTPTEEKNEKEKKSD